MAFIIVHEVARCASLFDVKSHAVVFQCFASYCDKNGRAWPSYKTISKRCGVHYRTVVRAFAWLRNKGYIVVIKRRHNNSSVLQITAKFFTALREATAAATSSLRNRLGIRQGSPRSNERAPRQPSPSRSTRSFIKTLVTSVFARTDSRKQQTATRLQPSGLSPVAQQYLERLRQLRERWIAEDASSAVKRKEDPSLL